MTAGLLWGICSLDFHDLPSKIKALSVSTHPVASGAVYNLLLHSSDEFTQVGGAGSGHLCLLIFITEKCVLDVIASGATAFFISFSILYTEALLMYTYVFGQM